MFGQSSSTAAHRGRRPESLTPVADSIEAAADGKVMSPFPWRWFGDPS
ncbi:hypothetical protein [Kitasatospora sp. NPDC056184]